MRVGGLILCGGESKRMGRPKAWLPFGPELMLQRIVRLVQDGVDGGPCVAVAAVDQVLPDLPPDVLIARDHVNGRGPLQGLAAGMEALAGTAELVYASATDAPFLNPSWIRRLVERIGTHDIVMPFLAGRHHPLSALYRIDRVLPVLRESLSTDRLRPADLASGLPTVSIGADELSDVDPTLETIRNINTPEEYARALADAGFAN